MPSPMPARRVARAGPLELDHVRRPCRPGSSCRRARHVLGHVEHLHAVGAGLARSDQPWCQEPPAMSQRVARARGPPRPGGRRERAGPTTPPAPSGCGRAKSASSAPPTAWMVVARFCLELGEQLRTRVRCARLDTCRSLSARRCRPSWSRVGGAASSDRRRRARCRSGAGSVHSIDAMWARICRPFQAVLVASLLESRGRERAHQGYNFVAARRECAREPALEGWSHRRRMGPGERGCQRSPA